jgi:Carboxypeptidase regulatory-like domain
MRVVSLLMLLALAQEPQKGTIEVNVRDSATGQPIAGADVTFIFFQTPPPNVVTRSNTDDAGYIGFSDLVMGRYSVAARRDGYIDQPGPGLGTTVIIDPQTLRKTVDLTLTRGATIEGRILDSKGLPLAQAQAQLLRKTYRDGRAVLTRVGSGRTETDDRGHYRLIGLAPGEYFLQAELRPTLTSAQDKYPRVSYYPNAVDVSSAAPIRITGTVELAGIDVRVPDTPAFTISGKIINATEGGRLLPNGQRQRTVASFFIGPRDPASLEEPILVSNRMYTSGVNDLNETPFELTGFVPGSYYLYPIVDGESGQFQTRRTAVEVTEKNIDGLTITIERSPDIRGRIVVDGDASTIRLEALRLLLRWKENLPSLVSIRVVPTIDPKTGEFTLKGVPESRFTPMVTGLPPDAYVANLRQGARNVYEDGIVTATNDSQDPIEITLNAKGGTIQGTVRNASQQAVASAGVVLVPDARWRGNSLLYKRMTSDAVGRFTMRGVAPGTYKLFAWPALPEGSAEENAEFIAPFEGRGTAVNMESGGTANVEVRVIAQ